MRYHEAASFLFDLRRFSVSPGTASVASLLDHLGNPEDDVAFVQVAGSNGKGSTARMTESVLREAGLSVGLYTSPHLEDLSERVRVDGRPMSDDAIAAFVAETKPWLVERAAAGEPLTFFEVVTAMGIWQFARRDVDVAVLEVGMGGEYDATSAVDPLAAAVTNVSLEHTAVLGDTVAEIARTKAKIAPADAPLVTACGGEALDVVREVAGEAGSRVVTVDGPGVEAPATDPNVTAAYEGRVGPCDAAVAVDGDGWAYDARIPLVGEHQATNAGVATALARATAAALDVDLADAAVLDGLARATWPGRFEVLETAPLVVLDGAHNPAACETLAETLADYDYDDLHLAFAAMHDKDHAGTVENLPTPDSVTTCRPDLDRAEDPEVLAAAFRNGGVGTVESVDAVADALRTARERADADDCVLVTGSLFAVAEARSTYTHAPRPVRVDDAGEAAALLEDADAAPATVGETAPSLDHRVVETRLQSARAERLTTAIRAADGECVVSNAADGGELVAVVCAGTAEAYDEATIRLAAAGTGMADVASDLRAAVELPPLDATAVSGRGGGSGPGAGSRAGDDAAYPWAEGTAVMGILNVTPDSFHDGGRHAALGDAVDGAKRMVAAGADILDVGGESTRPGAEPVPVEKEIDRVVPVVEAVNEVPEVAAGDVWVSVDTRKPAVAEAALEAGADVINDVTGLADPRMREVVAEAGCPVVVMHSVEAPVDPATDVEYEDVVADVIGDLQERLLLAERAGIDRERVIVDPGLGFGKSPAEDFELLGRVDEFAALGCPVLVGHSHKSLFGAIGRGPDEREAATVAGTAIATERGADVVRVHDVAANRAAVDAVEAAADPAELE
ncbi:dihydropteroate synthase [Haloparvum sedimenti]|uniref:dihydropteroate synthase n=1 Tax=Haloparvum sedimenti TaxID=1678448 RepID=UPI00071E8399|nr:dihydropteroate synthase [Haloparvum sedimenti]